MTVKGTSGDFDRAEVEALNRETVRKLVRELVECRKRRGMSQQDLADDMGVSVIVIREIESGKGDLVDGLVSYATTEGAVLDYELTLAGENLTSEGGDASE